MKTIKIFLASSEELKNDRVSFGNFIRELDKRYQQRGIRIDLYTWEGADGAYNGRRKQDDWEQTKTGMLNQLPDAKIIVMTYQRDTALTKSLIVRADCNIVYASFM